MQTETAKNTPPPSLALRVLTRALAGEYMPTYTRDLAKRLGIPDSEMAAAAIALGTEAALELADESGTDTRGHLIDAAEAALAATLAGEVAALTPGTALVWTASDLDDIDEVTDRHYAVARLADGSVDYGWDHTCGRWMSEATLPGTVLEWWINGVGLGESVALALSGSDSALEAVTLGGHDA